MKWAQVLDAVQEGNASPERLKDLLLVLSTTKETRKEFWTHYQNGDIDQCIQMIEKGLISPNMKDSGPILVYNVPEKLFNYVLSHPETDVNLCDRNGDCIALTYVTLGNNFKNGKIYQDRGPTTTFKEFQSIVRHCSFQLDVRVLEEAIRRGRYLHVKDLLDVKCDQLSTDQLYRLVDLCIREVPAIFVIQPFLDLERFILPQKYRHYDFYGPEIVRRKIVVTAKRFERWTSLPSSLCTLLAKYHVYNATPSPLLSVFAKVALGKERCNVKEILSVGGFWSEQVEEYLLRRRQRREMQEALQRLEDMVAERPEVARQFKKLKSWGGVS